VEEWNAFLRDVKRGLGKGGRRGGREGGGEGGREEGNPFWKRIQESGLTLLEVRQERDGRERDGK
jgi:predicted transposase YdaD